MLSPMHPLTMSMRKKAYSQEVHARVMAPQPQLASSKHSQISVRRACTRTVGRILLLPRTSVGSARPSVEATMMSAPLALVSFLLVTHTCFARIFVHLPFAPCLFSSGLLSRSVLQYYASCAKKVNVKECGTCGAAGDAGIAALVASAKRPARA